MATIYRKVQPVSFDVWHRAFYAALNATGFTGIYPFPEELPTFWSEGFAPVKTAFEFAECAEAMDSFGLWQIEQWNIYQRMAVGYNDDFSPAG